MSLGLFDYLLIASFLGVIIFIIVKGFQSNYTFPEFFNAGGRLNWLFIGLSILATNISFQYIMTSAYDGFTVGLAFGSYEWTASFVMIIVALYFIPRFLRIGILTLPEYLEFRFNRSCRILMAVIFVILQFGILIYNLLTNAIFMEQLWGVSKISTICFIALTGGIVIVAGGLGSKIKLDVVVILLFSFSALALLVLCFIKIKGFANFVNLANGRLDVVLPGDHKTLPWTSVFIGGLWFLHIQYWAFYQPIAQSVIASVSLSQAQKGILFAATFKLLAPVFMLVPGIIGYELFASDITSVENALPVIVKNVVPEGLGGIIFIGYLSTMFAAFTGYLHATVAVFVNDIYQHRVTGEDKSVRLVKISRVAVLVLVVAAILVSIVLSSGSTIPQYFFLLLVGSAPVCVSVFLVAMFSRRTPSFAAIIVIIIGIPLFMLLRELLPFSTINISGTVFLILCAILFTVRILYPLESPVVMPEKFAVKFERNLAVEIWGIFLLTAVGVIYILLL